MDDLIDREEAYFTLTEYYHHRTEMQHKSLRDALDRVPGKEIIHCKDCEFSEKKYFCKRGSDFVDVCEEVCDAPEFDFTKKIPFYSAKELNADRYQDGFYFAMPETTYCTTEEYERHPVKIHHFIVNHRMSDWGLPNRTEGTEIDPNTLKFIGWFTVRESYGTESWVERS